MGENKKTSDVIIKDETTQSEIFEIFDKETSSQPKRKKFSATTKTLIIAVCALVVLGGVFLALLLMPEEKEEISTDATASVTSVPDKNKVWQAEVKTKNGKILKNGAGRLLSLNTSDVRTIKLENDKGTTLINSRAPKSKTDARQYTVKGLEDFELQAGEPDEIASVCASLSFESVSCVDAGDKLKEFGFDKPRRVVSVSYNDGTKAVIKVGANAPQNLGTYLMFGSGKAVFLCETESVEHLLLGVTDLVSLKINEAAADSENSEPESITLSGKNFGDSVVIKPNEDSEINSDYIIASPSNIFADNAEASNVKSGVRGLYADKVTAVNPNADKLRRLGFNPPYASITAVYPDETISLIASKPDKDGNCGLMKKDGRIVYRINADKIAWINSSYEKLMSDYVLELDLKTVKKLKVDNFSFNIITRTINTTDNKGEESSTTKTKAFFKGKEIDEGNFETFFSNLSMLRKSDKTAAVQKGKIALKVVYSYSSGRSDDTLAFYKDGVVTINGTPVGKAASSYIEKLKSQAKALSKGDQIKSFW